MDENNKYTSLIEIGDLLQGRFLMADVKVRRFRTVDGVAMQDQVLVDMENVGRKIMAMVMNPSPDTAVTALFREPLTQFMTNAMTTMPSLEDSVFWQAMSTALDRWITTTSSSNNNARQLYATTATKYAIIVAAGGRLRGF